jgi:hypothetical protein
VPTPLTMWLATRAVIKAPEQLLLCLSNWSSRPSSRSIDMFAGRLIVAKSTLLDVRHDSRHGNGRTPHIMMTTEMIGAGQSRPSFR